jgi:hypothetical protein
MKTSRPSDFNELEIEWCPGKDCQLSQQNQTKTDTWTTTLRALCTTTLYHRRCHFQAFHASHEARANTDLQMAFDLEAALRQHLGRPNPFVGHHFSQVQAGPPHFGISAGEGL